MNKKVLSSLVSIIACCVSSLAMAVPVHATFNGTVTGSGSYAHVLSSFPVGTAASFDLTFDDSGFVPKVPVPDLDVGPVSGWVRLGGLEWLLDAGGISSYTYNVSSGDVSRYQIMLTGTGPTISGISSPASLFGLFLTVTPDLNPVSGIPFMLGFGYPVQGGTLYSYAHLSGTFATSQVSVPEPATGVLIISALGLLVGWRRAKERKI